MPEDILYAIQNLDVEYRTRSGPVQAVDQVSLDIRRGEILNLLWTDIDFKNERSTSENRRTAKGGLFRSAPNFEKLYSPCRRGLKTASSSPAIFHGVRERTPTLSASSSLLSI